MNIKAIHHFHIVYNMDQKGFDPLVELLFFQHRLSIISLKSLYHIRLIFISKECPLLQ